MNLRGEDGQSLVLVTISLVIILGMLGLVLDTGKVYIAQRHLQIATDAAALAAAQVLPDPVLTQTTACNYSATEGAPGGTDDCAGTGQGDNTAGLSGVTTLVQPECLSIQSTGIPCSMVSASGQCDAVTPMPPDGNVGCNAVQVTETVKVNPWLLGILGVGGQTVTSTSTASMAGGTSVPLDVEMIDDVTPSMQTPDKCGGQPTDVPLSEVNNLTQEDCAKAGIRALLSSLDPCQPNLAGCSPQSAVNGQIPSQSRLDEVGLVVFPGLVNPPHASMAGGVPAAVPEELNCTGDLSGSDETYSSTAQTRTRPATAPNYQIVPFSSDFRYSDTATRDPLATLYPTSHLVQAVYWPGDGCPNGGYPTQGGGGFGGGGGGGGTGSSIAGGGAGDFTMADNGNSPAGGGVATTTDRSATTNVGITRGTSQTLPATTTGIAVGGSQPATTLPGTIGGGSATRSTNDYTVNHQNTASSSLTLTMPSNTAATDMVLATITAQGNLTPNSVVCAAGPNWTPVKQDYSAGNASTPAILQATFYGFRSSTGSKDIGVGPYQFSFYSASCPGSLPGNGNLNVSASSGIAVHYSNVGGLDTVFGGSGPAVASTIGPALTTLNGSAGNITWPATTSNGKKSVSYQWTGTNYISLASDCASTSSRTCDDATVGSDGNVTGFNFILATGAPQNVTYTVTLLVNRAVPNPGLQCTIIGTATNHPTNCAPPAGNVAVNANDRLELRVVSSGFGTPSKTTATSSVTIGPSSPVYVSLASKCSDPNVANCDDAMAPSAGTISTAALTFGSPVPAGDTMQVELFNTDADTGLGCTTTGTGCTITANLAVNQGDTLSLQVSRVAGSVAYTSAVTQTTAAFLSSGKTLIAPSVETSTANDVVVRVFGSGSEPFGNTTTIQATNSTSTATGVDDALLATPGLPGSGTENETTTNTDNWVAQTIAFKPADPTSISINIPGDYVGGGTDLLLATIAVQSLGAGNAICAPTGWTPVAVQHSGPGATGGQGTSVSSPDASGVTQESFWTMTATTSPATFTFSSSSSCQAGAAPVHAGASAVVTNYTGVDTANPVDTVSGQPVAQAKAGTTSPLSAAPVTTSVTDEEVVGLYATDATGITVSGTVGKTASDGYTSSGDNSQLQAAPGSLTPAGATSNPANAAWTSETVALRPSLPTAIIVPYPADFVANDTLFVSIAVQGLGGGVVCKATAAEAADWHQIATTTSGTGATQLTQSTWWTSVPKTAGGTSEFDFSASMDGTGLCNGAAIEAGASAIATTYTGVDVVTTPPSVITNSGSGTTLTARANAGAGQNNEIVSLFATDDDFKAPLPTVHNTVHSAWSNSGEDAALGATTATTATTTNPANWTAQTITLTAALPTSITITPPSGYTVGGGNLLLVSIAAQGLGSGSICGPDATWKPIAASPASFTASFGTMSQESFYTATNTNPTDTFFFFKNGNCTGSPAHVAASAVSIVYTGIDPANPIDGTLIGGTYYPTTTGGNSPPMNPAPITPTGTGDEIAALYGTSATTLSGLTIASTGGFTNSGANDSIDNGAANVSYAPPGPVPTATPSTSDWTEETIALRPLGKDGITIARPPTPAANDFLLVAVTAKGLPSGTNICAPNDGTWTQEGTTLTHQGANPNATQALFYSARISGQPESYSFTFRSGACPAGGTAVSGNATAIAVRFTGVNPITPIDNNGVTDNYNFASGPTPATLTPATVTPSHTGDQLVGLYGAAASSITISPTGATGTGQAKTSFTTTAFWDKPAPATLPNATINPSSDWIEQTVALEAASSSCSTCVYGAEDPSGESTSYGLAIAAAETALNNEASSRPTAQKVIVLLSDGDANTDEGNPTTLGPCQYGIQQAELAEDTTQTTDNTNNGNTWFFVVAYGANYDQTGNLTPKSCQDDTAARGSTGALNGLSAQCALQLIVDNRYTNPEYAGLSDTQVESKICGNNQLEPSDPANHFYSQEPGTSLEQVFTQIAAQATQPRLISNSAD